MNSELPKSGLKVLSKKVTAVRCRNVHPNTPMRWANDPRFAHLNFPKPIQMADGSVGFYEHEIDAWLASRPRVGPSQPALPVELRVDRPAPSSSSPICRPYGHICHGVRVAA